MLGDSLLALLVGSFVSNFTCMKSLEELTDSEIQKLAVLMLPNRELTTFVRPITLQGRSVEKMFKFYFDRNVKVDMTVNPFSIDLHSTGLERVNIGAMVRYFQAIGVELP